MPNKPRITRSADSATGADSDDTLSNYDVLAAVDGRGNQVLDIEDAALGSVAQYNDRGPTDFITLTDPTKMDRSQSSRVVLTIPKGEDEEA